jgi:hypothetical protein
MSDIKMLTFDIDDVSMLLHLIPVVNLGSDPKGGGGLMGYGDQIK